MLRIKSLDLRGFRSVGEAHIELGPLNVFLGQNGAGKSNILSLFRLLNHAMSGHFQVFVGTQGGGSRLLHYGPKVSSEIAVKLDFASDTGVNSYSVRWVKGAGDRLIFAEEEITYQKEGSTSAQRLSLGGGQRESALIDEAATNPTAKFIKGALERFRVYQFHDTSSAAAIKQAQPINENRYLRDDGSNLGPFLLFLRENHLAHYDKIRRTISLVAPFFDDFALAPRAGNPSQILLEWRERDSDHYFDANDLSDGTLRFMCLATLLLQPNLPSAILIDEPELGLHPAAIYQLAALLRSDSFEAQPIVSTQSVTLIDQVGRADDLIIVERDRRARAQSTFRRLKSEELADWLQNYSLGELWLKNLLGARP